VVDGIVIYGKRVVNVVHVQFDRIHESGVDMFDRQKVLALAARCGFGELASVCMDEKAYETIMQNHLRWQVEQAREEKPQ